MQAFFTPVFRLSNIIDAVHLRTYRESIDMSNKSNFQGIERGMPLHRDNHLYQWLRQKMSRNNFTRFRVNYLHFCARPIDKHLITGSCVQDALQLLFWQPSSCNGCRIENSLSYQVAEPCIPSIKSRKLTWGYSSSSWMYR